ncbi:hypothetical protein pb186bvf_009583 [Paramecium bursaria]
MFKLWRRIKQTKIYSKYQKIKEELEDQKLNRICVGEDRMGNKFYQYYSYYGLPTRREIRFLDDGNKVVNDLAFYDWLYKRQENAPSIEELQQFYLDQEKRFQLARKWDEQQEIMMNSFREQLKLKAEQYKKVEQKLSLEQQDNEIFQEMNGQIRNKKIKENFELNQYLEVRNLDPILQCYQGILIIQNEMISQQQNKQITDCKYFFFLCQPLKQYKCH